MAELAVFVHGVLATFHALGVLYNWKRRNYTDVAIHGAAFTYDLHAVHKHIQDVRELNEAA